MTWSWLAFAVGAIVGSLGTGFAICLCAMAGAEMRGRDSHD